MLPNPEVTMKKLFILATLFALFLNACAAATPTPEPSLAEQPTEVMLAEETATPKMSKPETPAWFDATLTDARTGQTFSINGFKGKVVLVETMAQWCSNCMKQQTEVKAMREVVGAPDDLFIIGLDIDPNENAVDLKSYVEAREFNWLYAVPPAEAIREIGNLYTAQFLNPPSTPILIVDRNGIAHPLRFGIKSADELKKEVLMYLEEGMYIIAPKE